jgi:hypothetical protein
MTKKPDLDEPTRQIAERLLSMPPKPHSEMKIGKRKPKPGRQKNTGVQKKSKVDVAGQT